MVTFVVHLSGQVFRFASFMGHALLLTGEIGPALAHYSQSLALYDPAEHRQFAVRFGSDIGVAALGFRSLALWLLGSPEKALADASRALKNAQEIGQAATLMFALNYTAKTETHCGNYTAANSLLEQLIALADQKAAPYWKSFGISVQGCVLVGTGDTSGAVHRLTLGITALRSEQPQSKQWRALTRLLEPVVCPQFSLTSSLKKVRN
jgi:tetratricopeptide (TPR) repeat protein